MRFGFSLSLALYLDMFSSLWDRTWEVSEHKRLEFQVYRRSHVFLLEAYYTPKSALYSHQELAVEVGLLGLGMRLSLYDTRHGEDRREEVDTDTGTGSVQG